MALKNYIFFIFLFMGITITHASVTLYKTVPFNNVKMHKNDVIIADYDFANKGESDHNEIFCYDPSLSNVGYATWTYKNQLKSQNLPIFLKISSQYTGEYADRVGTINIVDTVSNDEDGNVIFMSCNFFG